MGGTTRFANANFREGYPKTVAVGTSPTPLLVPSADRKTACLFNNSDDVKVYLGGETVVHGNQEAEGGGGVLPPQQSFSTDGQTDGDNPFPAGLWGCTEEGTAFVSVWDFS